MKYDKGFAPYHRWDRNFFLLMVALMWLGILMGFVPDIIAHIKQHKPAYPLAVHIHAAAFVGWLLLLTAQVLLVRTGNPAIHKRLGIAGMVLAPIMVVLGPTAAIVVQRIHFGTKLSDPSFVAIQFGDMILFAVLAASAFLVRNTSPSAHKRLILLATIFIGNAGWARWWGGAIEHAVGDGPWQDWLQFYVADAMLVAIMAAYDVITRRKLHPAFVKGALFGLLGEVVIVWAYVSPWWKPVAIRLIGH